MKEMGVMSRMIFWTAGCGLGAGCASHSGKSGKPGVEEAKRKSEISVVLKPLPSTILQEAAAKTPAPFEGERRQPMFDGKTLTGWRATEVAGRGEVQCQNGLMVLYMGDPVTGIQWKNEIPKMDYVV